MATNGGWSVTLRGAAWGRGVGVAPDGTIWVQGDANAPFDVGMGTLVPRASDGFLLRVQP